MKLHCSEGCLIKPLHIHKRVTVVCVMYTVLHSKRVDFFLELHADYIVFFHRSQKTPRRHTKTFCLASTAIVHKAAYKYVCIDDAH